METEARYQQAVTAVRAGDYDAARRLLAELVRAEPRHEHGWLLLASVVGDLDRAIDCLNRVLAINPENSRARDWLARAQQEKARLAAVAELRTGEGQAAAAEADDIALAEPGDEERPVPRLGQYLLDFKFITEEQLRAALLAQRRTRANGSPRRIGDILLEQGAITAERLNFALREQHRNFYSLFDE